MSLLIITFIITSSNMATFKGSSSSSRKKNLSIPAKAENLEIPLREEIMRFLCKYRWRKKLKIRKSREKTRVEPCKMILQG